MRSTSNRAGRYIRQPQGYQAFIPNPLPPDPRVQITEELVELLLSAQSWLSRLDGAIESVPEPGRFVRMYVRREAVLSSQIEGTLSTVTDLLASEAKVSGLTLPADVREVSNYVAAMEHGIQLLEQLPISVRLIREIHRVLLAGVAPANLTPGELRTSQNWIGAPGASLRDAIFVPPPAQQVPESLGDLERFLHRRDRMPLLVRLAIAHVQFEMIHPFLDGNGRVGRLLITLHLIEQGVLRQPVLYISAFFRRNQVEYYRRLRGVQEEGDWEAWISFMLEGIAETGRNAEATARQVQRLREKHLRLIVQTFDRGAESALTVLDDLYRDPIVSVARVRELTNLTVAPANRMVSRMVDAGILVEITGQRRNRQFAYEPYIQLFDDPAPDDLA
ncbi:MAG: Fic family protein [Thermomicrobiales bacterium]|nr:Fic family protein [Thermomicrobiales bacterium]